MNRYKVTIRKRGMDVEYGIECPTMHGAINRASMFIGSGQLVKCEKLEDDGS